MTDTAAPQPEAKDREEFHYKAEVQKLLDILVHSVYSAKDVFVRELISNAADALEKVRFAKVQGEEVVDSAEELGIWIETGNEEDSEEASPEEASEAPRILTIRDNGIGMTREEVTQNLGTIAHSGAVEFLDRLKEGEGSGDVNLIGQFGIGFYSVFMVAERVVLTTRSADPGAEAVVWESDGLGSYTVGTPAEEVPRGTRIEIHLKPDEARFQESFNIENAIRNYSNFVPFPVHVNGEVKNKVKALWREPEGQASDEDYSEFYKFIAFDHQEPLQRLHFQTDSPLQFSSLLYVPQSTSETLGFGEDEVSLQLYVKRVMIDSQNSNLLPRYLRFVRGVVESEDLPLNISRETLQENRVIAKIREILTKRLLKQFAETAKNQPQEYLKFWETYGRILKEGYQDFANRERLQELLRFPTSAQESLTSLAQYVDRMPESQSAIYYLSGASREALERDPRLEIFRKKSVEVLYLTEVADEIVLSGLGDYQEKKLVSADQVALEDLADLGPELDEDESSEKASADELSQLLDRFREVLGDRVTEVRVSNRLVDSPVCLVSPDGSTTHMDRLMRAINKESELPKRDLEINAKHAMIQSLNRLVAQNQDPAFVEQACEQLYEMAMLTDGFLTDPHRLVERAQAVLREAAELKDQAKA